MKRISRVLLFLCLIHTFLFLTPASAFGVDGASEPAVLRGSYASSGVPNIDAVLVLDASNSMRTSDPNKLSAEAMNMFVDMLGVSGNKVGIISYTGQIEREKALTLINDADDKTLLKDFISQIQYGAWTDITVGLDEALRMMDDARDPSHNPVIILFTDGNNELSPNSSKTLDDCDADTARIVAAARAKGYPIYTIGLNYDGILNHEYLYDISAQTGAIPFEATNAEELPGILSLIFADQMELKVIEAGEIIADGEFQDVYIEIPDPNILEANVTFLSSNQLVDMELYDPSGGAVPLNGSDAVLSVSRTYSLLKIISPEQGTWRVRVKGADGDKIKINLLYNYEVGIDFKVDTMTNTAGEPMRATLTLLENGNPSTNTTLYQSATCTFYLSDAGTLTEFPGTYLPGEGMYAADIIVPEAKEYQLNASVEHLNFYRFSEAVLLHPNAAATSVPATAPATAPPTPVPTAAPTPTPSPIPAPTRTPATTPPPPDDGIWVYLLIGALVLAGAASVVFIALSRKRFASRVFTGRLVIEVTDNYTRERKPPEYRNLIEYGRRTTLADLLRGSVSPLLLQVFIFASPDAPSHIPQIIVKCANPKIKCRKDFMEQDLSKGVGMSFKSEMVLTLDAENKQVKLRYTE